MCRWLTFVHALQLYMQVSATQPVSPFVQFLLPHGPHFSLLICKKTVIVNMLLHSLVTICYVDVYAYLSSLLPKCQVKFTCMFIPCLFYYLLYSIQLY